MRHWRLAALALAPVLAVQALHVRRHARMLPEAAGARSGNAGSGPRLRLLIAGDSAAAGVGVARQDDALAGWLVAHLARDFTVEWQLHAETGATTASATARLRALGPRRFDVAVLSLGVNDVTHLVGLRRWLRQQADLGTFLTEEMGAQAVWRSGLPPMGQLGLLPWPLRDVLGGRAATFDAALAAASAGALHHLPFERAFMKPGMLAVDGYHPGAAIYDRWAELLADRIRAEFA